MGRCKYPRENHNWIAHILVSETGRAAQLRDNILHADHKEAFPSRDREGADRSVGVNTTRSLTVAALKARSRPALIFTVRGITSVAR